MGLKKAKILSLLIQVYQEKSLEKIEGFDNAVIGIEVKTNKLIYSVKKCISLLKKQMPIDEAIDHFYMEIYSENVITKKAIFCEDYLIKNH